MPPEGVTAAATGSALYDGWRTSLGAIQTLLNACAPGLPPFDVRKAQGALDGLAAAVEETRGRVQPRQRFRFSRRPTTAAAGASMGSDAAPAGREGAPSGAAAASSAPALSEDREVESEDERTYADLVGATLVLGAAELRRAGAGVGAQAGDGDLRLLRLSGCLIIITAPVRALRVDGLRSCLLISAPVAGSLLLHACEDTTVLVPTRQVRGGSGHQVQGAGRCTPYHAALHGKSTAASLSLSFSHLSSPITGAPPHEHSM